MVTRRWGKVKDLKNRLTSRKFLSPFIFGVLVAVNNAVQAEFGQGLTEEQVKDVFALIALFIAGESAGDVIGRWLKK